MQAQQLKGKIIKKKNGKKEMERTIVREFARTNTKDGSKQKYFCRPLHNHIECHSRTLTHQFGSGWIHWHCHKKHIKPTLFSRLNLNLNKLQLI